MKIISNEEYRLMKIKEQCLVDAIDRALMLLGNMDASKFSSTEIGVEENYYFWNAIGHLKGSLHNYQVKHKNEWIEP